MLSLVIADRSPVTQDIKSYGSCQPNSVTCLVSIGLLSDPHSCCVPITTFLTLTRYPQPLKESGAPAELGHSDARVPRGWGAETLVLLYGSTLGGFDPYLSGKGSVTAAAEKGMFTEKMSSSSLSVFAFKMSFALKEVSKLCHNPCPKGRELRCTHHWPQQVSAAAKLVSSPGSFSFDCLF